MPDSITAILPQLIMLVAFVIPFVVLLAIAAANIANTFKVR